MKTNKNILITGARGFIGSYLEKHISDKYNVETADIEDNYYKNLKKYDVVVHLGAISETDSYDKKYIFQKNLASSINILNKIREDCKLIYASSAAVYGQYYSKNGLENAAKEIQEYELGKSIYAQSKLIFDNIVRSFYSERPIIGLRFFNVCSFSLEQYKKQPSPTFSFLKQLEKTNTVKVFKNYRDVRRDFIYIRDVINIINFFIDVHISKADIINIGTGYTSSFEEIADAMIEYYGGKKVFVDVEPKNQDYQSYTRADISKLRSYGYYKDILSMEETIGKI